MNAAKKIRRFIEENQDPEQVQVLKDLAAALEMGRAFDLGSLYQIDMRYFEVALDLKDWRFDHHIAARSKLLEQLLTEIAPDLRADNSTAAPTAAVETA
jgi:sulfur relay (sulfurtransferase) DsrF/TusC family protein